MKKLEDSDLSKMIDVEFIPDDKTVAKQVRSKLKLRTLIPEPEQPVPEFINLDLHGKTEDQSWEEINNLIKSGTRRARIITGASGILKIKFVQWITTGILSKHISSWKVINNGSYEITLKRNQDI